MDSNCGPLSSEATALPTEPQQLPGHSIKLSVCATVTEHHRQSAVGSGCGSFGRAVSTDSRGPRFESCHRQKKYSMFTVNCIVKTKIKKKKPGPVHLKNVLFLRHLCPLRNRFPLILQVD